MAKSGLTMDEIRAWGGDAVFAQGLEMVSKGAVVAVSYNAGLKTICGEIERRDGCVMSINLKRDEKGCIESHCPCHQNQMLGQICHHVVALGIALVIVETEG